MFDKKVGIVRASTISILLVFLTSCASPNDIPKDAKIGADFAEVTYEKGYSGTGFGSAANQFYAKSYTDVCKEALGGAKFAPFGMGGDAKTVLFYANRRTYVYAFTNFIKSTGYVAGVGGQYGQNACANKIAFTPKPGASYKIKQSRHAEGPCDMTVIDQSTGKAPEDLEILTPGCKQ